MVAKKVLFVCHHGVLSGTVASEFREFVNNAAPGSYHVDNMALHLSSGPHFFDEQKLLNADHIVAFYRTHLEEINKFVKQAGLPTKTHHTKSYMLNWEERLLEEIEQTSRKIL